jgi:hypothetical protein
VLRGATGVTSGTGIPKATVAAVMCLVIGCGALECEEGASRSGRYVSLPRYSSYDVVVPFLFSLAESFLLGT